MRLVLTLEETFQAVRRAASEVRVRSGFHRDGTLAFRDIEANYLVGAYADIADRVVAKGSYTSNGPYRTPAVRIRRAEPALEHRPVDRLPRLRQPAADLGGRVEHGRGGASGSASTRSSCGSATSPIAGDPFIPGDLPADGEWAETVGGPPTGSAGDRRCRRAAAGASRWASSRGRRPGSPIRPSGCWSTAASSSDRRDLGHGPGARTIFAQIAAQELGAPVDWVTVVSGDTANVPYDQQTSASRSSVLMGNAVLLALPRRPGEARGDGRAAGGGRRRRGDRGPRRGADRRPGVADHRRADPRPRPAGRRGHRGRRDAQGGGRRSIRWVARPRSTSSTAPPSRCRSTGRPAT